VFGDEIGNEASRWARAKVFNYDKTSVGRAIAFGCATRCHLSVHSLAMPRSGPDVASHGRKKEGKKVIGDDWKASKQERKKARKTERKKESDQR